MSDRDVSALPYMPLFVDRLLLSDTWNRATGDEAKAAASPKTHAHPVQVWVKA